MDPIKSLKEYAKLIAKALDEKDAKKNRIESNEWNNVFNVEAKKGKRIERYITLENAEKSIMAYLIRCEKDRSRRLDLAEQWLNDLNDKADEAAKEENCAETKPQEPKAPLIYDFTNEASWQETLDGRIFNSMKESNEESVAKAEEPNEEEKVPVEEEPNDELAVQADVPEPEIAAPALEEPVVSQVAQAEVTEEEALSPVANKPLDLSVVKTAVIQTNDIAPTAEEPEVEVLFMDQIIENSVVFLTKEEKAALDAKRTEEAKVAEANNEKTKTEGVTEDLAVNDTKTSRTNKRRRKTANDIEIIQQHKKYEGLIAKYSEIYDVDPLLIKCIMYKESGFNPNAVSPAGAIGLMQLMPDTARCQGVKNIYNPEENIHGGVKYFSKMMKKFENNVQLALAAYNAGPNNVIGCGYRIPRNTETQTFVSTILTNYNGIKAAMNAQQSENEIYAAMP